MSRNSSSSAARPAMAHSTAEPDCVRRTESVTATSARGRAGGRFAVLGVSVDAVQIPEVIAQMRNWIGRRDAGHYIAVTGMHGVMEAQHDARFKGVLAEADLVVPDGAPLVWLGRLRGHSLRRRVYGPELMLRFCRKTAGEEIRHFLYGGGSGVPERLASALQKWFHGIQIAGTYSPPFAVVSPEEDAAIVDAINRAAPDVLWVGLGTPKQEAWMREHRDRLRVPVMVGVGAAFDFLSGHKTQAPAWMRGHGLEWLFRLLQEPRRLWRRYLLDGSRFLVFVALEMLGLRRFG
jgi:N-acetylglucosaminyldiphosphoundecaprenol N-acetyl-beta-D-mannosaminyltransferase